MASYLNVFTIESYDEVHSLWKETEEIGLTECDTKEGIRAYLLRNPGMSFIAKDGDVLVGAVLCGHDGRRGYIHHLAVCKDYRRQGLGRQLVDHCLSALKKERINKCHIFIFNTNDKGVDFWKAVGWKQRSDIHIISRDIKI